MARRPLWDIFCVVVDNFGDVGVTWRLARQLVAEYDLDVRLWIDDLTAFSKLCLEANSDAESQLHAGVTIRHWPTIWHPCEPGDVVIEAFACQLPADYVLAMSRCERRILWLNLEYLSAEDWIVGCHGLPSMQPGGLQKYFFFPGFTQGTGGLIRERGLLARRRHFQQSPGDKADFLRRLGVVVSPEVVLLSLFAYENEAIPGWLDALASADRRAHLLIPEGRVMASVAAWLGEERLEPGGCGRRGSLSLTVLPFLSQDDYDHLLWCCDFNAVRGEESFIRAQWAGRPFVWHIYPQDEEAHWTKLWAFFDVYAEQLPPVAAESLKAFWYAWNAGQGAGDAWTSLLPQLEVLRQGDEAWVKRQEALGDLAGKLVSFYRDWL